MKFFSAVVLLSSVLIVWAQQDIPRDPTRPQEQNEEKLQVLSNPTSLHSKLSHSQLINPIESAVSQGMQFLRNPKNELIKACCALSHLLLIYCFDNADEAERQKRKILVIGIIKGKLLQQTDTINVFK